MSKRDPEAKVAQIIAAAIPEFARDGWAGARIDAIAATAGMNKRLLYHYLGDKEALFAATVEACKTRVAAGIESRGPDAHGWRVLCNAAAVGAQGDLRAVAERLSAGLTGTELVDGVKGDAVIALVGLELLECLLPELVDVWLGQPANPGERRRSLKELRQRFWRALDGAKEPKPRIKLKPDLRPL